MSRRLGARPSRRQSNALGGLASQVRALSRGLPQFFASRYTVDGVSGKTASFIDANDPTHSLLQSVALGQVAIPAAHADFAGKLCATTTGVETYQSNRSTAFWDRVARGADVETFRVFTPLAGAGTRVLDITTGTGTSPGHQFYWDPAANVTASLNRSGGGSQDVMTPQTIGATGVDVPTYASLRFRNPGDANQFECRRKSALSASGAYANPPSILGVSGLPLTLFANAYPVAALGAVCRWSWWGMFPALSSSQRAIVQLWIQSEFGIAP